MKTYRRSAGPVREQPYFSASEVERICSDELSACGLYPSSPQPIRIDRFVEKRFKVTYEPEELSENVLGYTRFGPKGVQAIFVSRVLLDDPATPAKRRVTTTLAHEAGHGLLHAHLFVLEADRNLGLFGQDPDVSQTKILCRDPDARSRGGYDGRWWELQANMAMAALVLPKGLVLMCLKPCFEARGSLGTLVLPELSRAEAIRLVSETFDVNPIVAKLRLARLCPEEGGQLTL
jgi:hypothetical protein